MAQSLDQRLHTAGCQSTRVRVLASRYASVMEPLILSIEILGKVSEGNNAKEAAFDTICESWYLSDTQEDEEAIRLLKADIASLEEKFRN
jgi:hypothetical protein